jgi:hypothetical protein
MEWFISNWDVIALSITNVIALFTDPKRFK